MAVMTGLREFGFFHFRNFSNSFNNQRYRGRGIKIQNSSIKFYPGHFCTKRQFRASFKTGSNPQSDEEEFCQKG